MPASGLSMIRRLSSTMFSPFPRNWQAAYFVHRSPSSCLGNGLLQSWKHFPAVIAGRLELARGNSAGIELFHEAFVAELFHKPVVDKLAAKHLGRPDVTLFAVQLGDVAALINLVYQTCIHRIFSQGDLGFRRFDGIQNGLHALGLRHRPFAQARRYSFVAILRALDPFLLEN